MAAAIVARAARSGCQSLLPKERVDERRFAYARRTHDGNGPSWGEVTSERVEAIVVERGDDVQRDPRRKRLERRELFSKVGAEVGLVEHDDRFGLAFDCQRDITLDSARVELRVERAD